MNTLNNQSKQKKKKKVSCVDSTSRHVCILPFQSCVLTGTATGGCGVSGKGVGKYFRTTGLDTRIDKTVKGV